MQHSFPYRRPILSASGRVNRSVWSATYLKWHASPTEDGTGAADGGGSDEEEEGGGVIPQQLYRALALIGMEDAEEGPVVTEDELGMLADVLRGKLEAFGADSAVDVDEPSRAESSNVSGGGGTECGATVEPSEENDARSPGRADFVEWYKEGQRRILRLALEEVTSLMPGAE